MRQVDNDSLELVRASALRGVHEAQVLYGQMLLDGEYVERNATAALHWFERAAQGGNLMAVNMVGRCFDQGWGVTRSAYMAEMWFRKAAERGLDWGMYNLATLLTLGEGGVPEDKVAAFHWFRKAADLGHVKSINMLGGFYEDGWVVRADRAMARDYYRRAAIGGDFRGQFNYARFLIQEGDVLGALHWLRQIPGTATPAFMKKVKEFLATFSDGEIKDFALGLD
jgi:TPR repeat protein